MDHQPTPPVPSKHRLSEDLFALIIGAIFVGMGLQFLQYHHLLTGGTAGLALLLSQLLSLPFALIFFIINLPFYALGWRYLGWRFILKTFISVTVVSVSAQYIPLLMPLHDINRSFASIAGGLLIGTGLLVFFRHGSSLGGVGILAVWLQKRWGFNAGVVQLSVDALILITCLGIASLATFAFSALSILAINGVIGLNHKPGRYQIT